MMLLLSALSVPFSAASAENVIKLEAVSGTESEYSVAQLLCVELMGDSIRFINTDGTVAAEVYKYDYVKLTVEEVEPSSLETVSDKPSPATARKVLIDGRVYILFGDKVYLMNGAEVR